MKGNSLPENVKAFISEPVKQLDIQANGEVPTINTAVHLKLRYFEMFVVKKIHLHGNSMIDYILPACFST